MTAIIANQIDATLHLYMFKAKADPELDVHLMSQMKNPRDMKNGARRAAMTPSTVDEKAVAIILGLQIGLWRVDATKKKKQRTYSSCR
jgi:hypothetical protein